MPRRDRAAGARSISARTSRTVWGIEPRRLCLIAYSGTLVGVTRTTADLSALGADSVRLAVLRARHIRVSANPAHDSRGRSPPFRLECAGCYKGGQPVQTPRLGAALHANGVLVRERDGSGPRASSGRNGHSIGTRCGHSAATSLARCLSRNEKPPLCGGFPVERAGLEPATPSLQILLRGGLEDRWWSGPRKQAVCRAWRRQRWSLSVNVI
jgi:hypothetical protein